MMTCGGQDMPSRAAHPVGGLPLPGAEPGFPPGGLPHPVPEEFWDLSGDRRCGRPETPISGRPAFEVADVFRLYGDEYRRTHTLTPQQARVMHDIETCRTPELGCHADVCEACGHVEIGHNSCHNRHCPKCQGVAKRRWVEARLGQLMPIPYFHVVFTLPNMIFPLCMHNQKLIYDLLFESAAETLKAFGRDPKWLGSEIGFYGILHTWGQTMWLHPHLHLIVTGGGLSDDGEWVIPKCGGRFLFPVCAVSKVFRGKFVEGLKKAYYDGELTIPDENEDLREPRRFEQFIDRMVCRKWVVYAKAPFSGPEEVVRYIGRYTHRVAISNYRIISVKDGQVTFSYKDHKDGGIRKAMTLTAEEFIRRFLLHVLPEGFHRIRHYGILANGKARKTSEKVRDLLKAEGSTEDMAESSESNEAEEDCRRVCPACGKGRMATVIVLRPNCRVVLRDDLMPHLAGREAHDSS